VKHLRVVTAVAVGGALWIGVGLFGWSPIPVTGQMMPLDSRVSQVEQRVDELEKGVNDLRERMTSAPSAPGIPLAPSIACRDLRTEPLTTSSSPDDGGYTYTTTRNYSGVQGLSRVEFNERGTITITYSVPDWVLQAYGGNMTAILRELETGRLQNQRPQNNCTP